ncbi:MAG: hypothetical protein QM613_04905 [Micrococcaceae bacterium]
MQQVFLINLTNHKLDNFNKKLTDNNFEVKDIQSNEASSVDNLIIYSDKTWVDNISTLNKINFYQMLSKRLLANKPTLCAGTVFNALFTSYGETEIIDNTGISAKTPDEFWYRNENNHKIPKGYDEWPGKVGKTNVTQMKVARMPWELPQAESVYSWDFEQVASVIAPPKTLFADNGTTLVAVDNHPLAGISADIDKTEAAQNFIVNWAKERKFL